MNNEDLSIDIAYLPNGELNIPVILANANLLLREGEFALATSLFCLIKNQSKMSHCGHYGLGQCFLATGNSQLAAKAFEKAFSIANSSYIGLALLEALYVNHDYENLESKSLEFATLFVNEPDALAKIREFYQKAIDQKRTTFQEK